MTLKSIAVLFIFGLPGLFSVPAEAQERDGKSVNLSQRSSAKALRDIRLAAGESNWLAAVQAVERTPSGTVHKQFFAALRDPNPATMAKTIAEARPMLGYGEYANAVLDDFRTGSLSKESPVLSRRNQTVVKRSLSAAQPRIKSLRVVQLAMLISLISRIRGTESPSDEFGDLPLPDPSALGLVQPEQIHRAVQKSLMASGASSALRAPAKASPGN